MRRFNSWTTAALLLCSPYVDAANTWHVVGVGSTASCGAFVKAEEAVSSLPGGEAKTMTWEGKTWIEHGIAFEQWLLGFVSAANLALGGGMDGSKQIEVDGPGTIGWVKHYCEEHADEKFVEAAVAFLAHQRQKMK